MEKIFVFKETNGSCYYFKTFDLRIEFIGMYIAKYQIKYHFTPIYGEDFDLYELHFYTNKNQIKQAIDLI